MRMAACPTSGTSFFNLILTSTLYNGKLKIPRKFVKDHGDELAECVNLSVPSGRSWNVRIRRESNSSIWFHDGLLKFMEDNSIGIGFFLIFKYREGLNLIVRIFDLTATEIQYNHTNASATSDVNQILNADIRGASGDSEKAKGGDDSIECLGSSAGHLLPQRPSEQSKSAVSYKPSKHVSPETDNIVNVCSTPTFANPSKSASTHSKEKCFLGETDNIKELVTRRKKQMLGRGISVDGINVCVTPQRRDDKNSSDFAKAISIEAKNKSLQNSFEATLTLSNINSHFLNIPSNFAPLPVSDDFTRLIKLVDAENNEWMVRYIHKPRKHCLSQGWGHFVRDKKLKAGDVCTFKQVGGDKVEMKVTISYRSNRPLK